MHTFGYFLVYFLNLSLSTVFPVVVFGATVDETTAAATVPVAPMTADSGTCSSFEQYAIWLEKFEIVTSNVPEYVVVWSLDCLNVHKQFTKNDGSVLSRTISGGPQGTLF